MNEVENTFRALKDEAPLATGKFCWLGWHKWTKWAGPYSRQEGVWQVDYQTRYCAHCHSLAIKTLRRF